MIMSGFGFGHLLIQIFGWLLVLAWIGLAIYDLVHLRKQAMSATAKALWTAVILLIPLLGAVAYLIVAPKEG